MRSSEKFPNACGDDENRLLPKRASQFLSTELNLFVVLLQNDDLDRIFLLLLVEALGPDDCASLKTVLLSHDLFDGPVITFFKFADFP